MSNLETAVQLKTELDALRPLTVDQEQRIWQKFRFDWNYHSNNIEGNSLTFGETKSLLLHNITAQGKPLKDHIEITGHNEAINALLDLARGDTPLTESFFRSLHQLILRERYQVDAITPDGQPTKKWVEVGQYKQSPNHVLTVTGEIFRFAEPVDVPERMRTLIQEVNGLRGTSDAEVLVAAAKIHYDFVLIHPFDDGNGRMARLLMNLILIKYGFPPAIIKTEDKANYFSVLRQTDGGQIGVFVEYVAERVCASLQIMLAGARGESIDEPDEQDRQIRMLEKLLESKAGKITAVRSIATLTDVYDHSLSPLALRIHSAAMKFSRMYIELQTTINIDSSSIQSPDMEVNLQVGRSKIRDSTGDLTIYVAFSYLKYPGLDSFGHSWIVQFHPSIGGYSVKVLPQEISLSKSYDQQLTDEEVRSIVAGLTAGHIAALEKASGVSLANLST